MNASSITYPLSFGKLSGAFARRIAESGKRLSALRSRFDRPYGAGDRSVVHWPIHDHTLRDIGMTRMQWQYGLNKGVTSTGAFRGES